MLHPQALWCVFWGHTEEVVLTLPLMFMGLGYFSETPLLSLVVSCSWEELTPSITVVTSAGSTSRARPTGRSTWMRKCSLHPTTCMGTCVQTVHAWGWAETLPKKESSIPATHPCQKKKKSRLKSHPKAGSLVAGRGGEEENSRRCSANSFLLVYSLAPENTCCALAKLGKKPVCPPFRRGKHHGLNPGFAQLTATTELCGSFAHSSRGAG